MNLKMIEGVLKSPKTPKHLKKALLKKYGSQLKIKNYGALAATVISNPKKRANIDHLDGVELDADESTELDIMGGYFKRKKKAKPKPRLPYDSIGEVYAGNPRQKYDIIAYKEDGKYYIIVPKKKYIGAFKTEAKMRAFIKPALQVGMTLDDRLV